jgi:hypothetical protein
VSTTANNSQRDAIRKVKQEDVKQDVKQEASAVKQAATRENPMVIDSDSEDDNDIEIVEPPAKRRHSRSITLF